MTTRTEEDLLGTAEVPADVYYGIHALRAVDNFQISQSTINDFPAFIRGMVQVKKATALANRRLHVLPRDKAEAIVWACDQILDEGRCMDQWPTDVFQGGAGTSVNMNTNEVVANLALEHLGREKGEYDVINPNDDVNMSQSTNDAYPTGFRLGVYYAVQELLEELDKLQKAFRAKGDEFADIIKMGRTQLQDAVPMTLGQEFTAFGSNLSEEQRTISNAAESLLEVNLGATAIGTGINTPSGYKDQVVAALREVTGLDIQASPDLIEATSDTGSYVMMHGAIKRAAMKLSKICNDLRLLSSGPRAGLNEINLPERQAGSSIMPAKVNPVIPEVVNQVAFLVIGHDLTVTMCAEGGQLQLNAFEPTIGYCVLSSLRMLTAAIDTLTKRCVDGIEADRERCRSLVQGSIGLITALAPALGYEASSRVARRALKENRSVADIVLEEKLLTEDQLNQLLELEAMTRPARRQPVPKLKDS